ncbi:MAG: dicarboxylate/amino acid:cation symporter [Myxococcales bacterium]|nr:dicarboxylate/amino acid:cation symporter [Myxococcota bacterium]MDW8281394.1 dicarboxylate/amino acid:cation symporter [Myxococcales bacterium]
MSSERTPGAPWRPGLTTWIFVGLALGVLFGWLAPQSWAIGLKPIGKLFIRLIKMIVAPLVFSSLVVGLCSAGSRHIGRLLIRSLLWFWLATSVALAVGLGAANLLRPGEGATPTAGAHYEGPTEASRSLLEQVVPESIVRALADNAILQIVFFSVLFGMGLAALGERGRPLVEALRAVTDVMFKVTEYVMRFAPIGVGAAMAAAVGQHGTQVLLRLAKLVGSLYLALAAFVVLLLVAVKLLTGLHVRRVLAALKEPLFLAFSTTSSESALPKAMQAMERLGVPPYIVGFVIPAGYSFNLDGTTLYLALASLFIAQAAGVSMGPEQQLGMMLTLLLTSKGVAAVPRASLVVLASTCASFGLPVDWIATILGVDEVMDMARTTVNVLGNCLASVVVARWERVLPQDAPLLGGPLPDQEPA